MAKKNTAGTKISDIPRTVSVEELRIGDLVMRCYVLDNGERVIIEGPSFDAFIKWNESGATINDADLRAFAKFAQGVK